MTHRYNPEDSNLQSYMCSVSDGRNNAQNNRVERDHIGDHDTEDRIILKRLYWK
jgi:hypothetical protein